MQEMINTKFRTEVTSNLMSYGGEMNGTEEGHRSSFSCIRNKIAIVSVAFQAMPWIHKCLLY